MKDQNKSDVWWKSAVIYQIYPRSFNDTTGNGVGDLQGIVEKLDYLVELGIDAIWISPFYPSPMKDFGYDVSDYCNIDSLFGDLKTFDRLLAEAHQRKMRVLLDWVPNHTSDEHPWFKASRSSRNNTKRDWYIWRDPKADGSPPNNWGSFLGGPAWTLDEQTGQYYLHQFLPGQPELNWRNPEVKSAMFDSLRFWLDRGVDGFRMDVIGLIIKDEQLRNNPTRPGDHSSLPENDIFNRLLDVYNLDQDEVHPVLKDIRKLLDEYGERVAIGELYGPLERWIRYYGENGDEIHLPFNFRLLKCPWRASAMRHSIAEMEAALPDFAWPNYVLGSHDFPRLATRFGGQPQSRVAAMLLLNLRGTPTLYYGDELGIENGTIPREKIQDPQGINLGTARTRDVSRTPMQWDAGDHAGFSTSDPWLPVADDYRSRNVAVMEADPHSTLNLYRELLSLRKNSPALQEGRYTPIDLLTDDCLIYRRETDSESCVIALNFTDTAQTFSLAKAGQALIALSSHLDREGELPLNDIRLRPHEGIIFRETQEET